MYPYMEHLPAVLQDVREYQAIGAAIDAQANGMQMRQSSMLLEKRIGSASHEVVARWEQVLFLEENPALTLDERRFRVLSRIRLRMVVTLRKLQEQLGQLTDEGATVSVDYVKHILRVRLALRSKHNYSAVVQLLNETTPANLIKIVDQLYNRWSDFSKRTWRELSSKTWRQLREEVIEPWQ